MGPPKITLFLISQKHIKTQWILTILTFSKLHLKKSHFIFVTRLMLVERPAVFLSYVPSGFNIFVFGFCFSSMYLPRSARFIVRPN